MRPTHAISFLGIAPYKATRYHLPPSNAPEDGGITTPFAALATAGILGATSIQVICTAAARAKHGEGMVEEAKRLELPLPAFTEIPDGQNNDEIWSQFGALLTALRVAQGGLAILDITNGFRSQPFFAAAAVAFVRSVDEAPPDVRVVYGAFDPASPDSTPIWELTPFVELLDWSRALTLFLRTGRAEGVVEPTQRIGREVQRRWAVEQQRQGVQPRIGQLATALKDFGDDLVTVRARDLLAGDANRPGSAARLATIVEGVQDEVLTTIPPLHDVLAQVSAMTDGLAANALHGPEGDAAHARLARLYLEMGRYAEAAAVVREGWVTRSATPEAASPGPGFDPEARKAAEDAWYHDDPLRAQSIAQVRNDIEHAGYNKQPLPATKAIERVNWLVEDFEATTTPQADAAPEVNAPTSEGGEHDA